MAKKQTLFAISEDMQALDDLLEGADFDDQEVQESLAKWADEIQVNLEEKVDNYAAFIAILQARSATRKAEAARLAKKSKTDSNKADRLKEHLKVLLTARNMKKIEGARFTVTVANAGGKQSVECNVLGKDLPKDLQKDPKPQEIEADKDAIRERLLAGVEVPGCRLLERGTYLKIS